MASNPEIERLRAEVRKAQRAANQKISRNRQKGIEVAGSQFDVRRELSAIRNYNRRQLNAYLTNLLSFNSRATQFVAASEGKPIPRRDWNRYKAVEAKVNALGREHAESVGDYFIPTARMTIRQREATLVEHRIEIGNKAVNRPFIQLNREAGKIADADALAQLTKQMESKTRKKYLPEQVKKTKNTFVRMLSESGDDDLAEKLHRLTTNQADVLFNYTNAADIVSGRYGVSKMLTEGAKEKWHAGAVETQGKDLNVLLEWARTQIPRAR